MRLGVFVVSLPASVQRRAEMQRQLAELNLAFDFIDGTDARQLPEAVTAASRRARAERFAGDRALTPGEIGCALGHCRAYEALARRDLDGAIVLEDDVRLTPLLRELADWLAATPTRPEIWASAFWLGGAEGIGGQEYLVTSLWRRITYAPQHSLERMVRSEKFVIRACGYFIGKEAARRIGHVNAAPATVADDWKGFYRAGLLQAIYIARPPVLHHPLDLQGSLLEADRYVINRRELPAKMFAAPRRAIRPAKAALRRLWRSTYRLLP